MFFGSQTTFKFDLLPKTGRIFVSFFAAKSTIFVVFGVGAGAVVFWRSGNPRKAPEPHEISSNLLKLHFLVVFEVEDFVLGGNKCRVSDPKLDVSHCIRD